jgi:FAD/FMN-containing dehydrogenase
LANIGGLMATRSIGQFSTLYGGIEDLVVGLEAVLANGDVVRIKDVPRRAAGPDLRHLFIGSEGALAFITEATLKLFPYLPEERWMHAYAVKGMRNGLDLIRDIMVQGYKPAVVRLHDPSEVEILFGGIAPAGYSLLLFLADGPKPITDVIGKAIEEVVNDYDTIDLGTKPIESWLATRNDVAHDMDNDRMYQLGLMSDTCEISAKWSKIGVIYDRVVSRISTELPNTVFIGGHSSHSYINGTNIYFTFGFKVENDQTAEEEYMNLIRVIMEETLEQGGSIAHHHGVGKYRTKWQSQEHGSSYPLMVALKEMMDPNEIFNKGALIRK